MKHRPGLWLAACLLLGLAACTSPEAEQSSITLATTTSARDSGLLDSLLPLFTEETGVAVKVIAVGSGQAMEIGRRGDADLLLVHAPRAEEEFVAAGHGVKRHPLMHNDFVIAGPTADPAGIAGNTSLVTALSKIADAQSKFVSRGDASGTHQKELELWQEAEIQPASPWYLESGSGMAATLRIAHQQHCYTMVDRSTFLALRDQLDLKILCEGDPLLRNDYSVILVNPAKHPHAKVEAAQKLIDFLLSPCGQQHIAEFGRERFGQSIFFPDAIEAK